ncbi:DUF2513 domain-containing protein [Legionella israelensis]|uniref:DUF2513 domain-containing protein n=1 Tax=Legionella israelensis TaxID=454 RepID=UPI00117D02B2|nr:DUF2513 domain-containing protein [Legionella israelensis]QDP72186.1 DUF2513 domain-containing protein [Legionella israelensis]
MKRNWDLVRKILLKVEETPQSNQLKLEDFPDDNGYEVTYHVQLLIDAGLIDANIYGTTSSEPNDFLLRRLTWHGHEFLDSVKNESIWLKTKETFKSKGISMTFETIKTVAIGLISKYIGG